MFLTLVSVSLLTKEQHHQKLWHEFRGQYGLAEEEEIPSLLRRSPSMMEHLLKERLDRMKSGDSEVGGVQTQIRVDGGKVLTDTHRPPLKGC